METLERLARQLFGRERDFRVRLWNGWELPAETEPERFVLRVETAAGLAALCAGPDSLSLGEAYVRGDCEVDGDWEAVFSLVDRLTVYRPGVLARFALRRALRGMEQVETSGGAPRAELRGDPCSRARTATAVRFHYDLPVEFWKLWLDAALVYSCAYFDTSDTGLEEAQGAKLDLVCRKLRLQPGERLLDLGCGWGGLVCHAVQHYGVEALGLTLSPRQAAHAQQRITTLGLAGRCRVEVRDFRDLGESAAFDKIASVGSVEHVRDLAAYFRNAHRLLRPEGWFLNHGITTAPTRPLRAGASFLERYVFPDYSLTSIGETVRHAELAGFEVRDVENLREHYCLTLDHWRERLEAHRAEVEHLRDAETFRVFRLYLAGTSHEFRVGRLHLHQMLLLKSGGDLPRAPLTRRDWFAP